MDGQCDTPQGRICRQPDSCECAPVENYPNSVQYREMVDALKKSPLHILADMKLDQMDALHMAVGVSGEAGELLDAIKKWTIYQKPLDRENVVEELGDLEFYMEGLRQALGIRRVETLEHNIRKLSTRYLDGYSDAAAIARADKEVSSGTN